MMNSIEMTAKTTEDAISAGLEKLGVSISDVKVEILEEGSKGLFGLFGSRPAKVRLTLIEEEAGDEVKEIFSAPAETKPAKQEAPAKPVKAEKAEKAKAEKPAETEKPDPMQNAYEQIQAMNVAPSVNANRLHDSSARTPIDFVPEQNTRPLAGTKLYQTSFPVNIGCHFYRILQVFDIKPDFIGITGFFLTAYRKILSLSCLFRLHFGQVLSQ